MAGMRYRPIRMGLDVVNGLFGNIHLNWSGTRGSLNGARNRDYPIPLSVGKAAAMMAILAILRRTLRMFLRQSVGARRLRKSIQILPLLEKRSLKIRQLISTCTSTRTEVMGSIFPRMS